MPRAKSPKATATNPKNPETPAITLLRKANCKSLGNGTGLTYEVGKDADDTPAFRLTGNKGGGFFSYEWVSLSAIVKVLDAWPGDRPLTSYALAPLFRGKSANNPAFLAAVLVAESLLRVAADKRRHLERVDTADLPEGFVGFGATQARRSRRKLKPTAKAKAGSKAPRRSNAGSANTELGPKKA
jgi:hypothetical protein